MARVDRVVCPYDGTSGTPSPTPVIRVCSPVLSQMAMPSSPRCQPLHQILAGVGQNGLVIGIIHEARR